MILFIYDMLFYLHQYRYINVNDVIEQYLKKEKNKRDKKKYKIFAIKRKELILTV
jgi:hypothetical protein